MLVSINNFSKNEPLRTFCQRGKAKNPEYGSLCLTKYDIYIIISDGLCTFPIHRNPVTVNYLLLL